MFILVPIPSLNVGHSFQIVNQVICKGTAVRGITSDVNIVWRRSNTTLKHTTRVTGDTAVGNYILVYRDSYIIPQLSTADDDDVMYECRLVVYATPPVIATVTFQLYVTGEYLWNLHNCDCDSVSLKFCYNEAFYGALLEAFILPASYKTCCIAIL